MWVLFFIAIGAYYAFTLWLIREKLRAKESNKKKIRANLLGFSLWFWVCISYLVLSYSIYQQGILKFPIILLLIVPFLIIFLYGRQKMGKWLE